MVRNLFHHTVKLQSDTDRFRHVARVLDAHAEEFGDFIELADLSLSDRLLTLLVDELNDAVGLALVCRLTRHEFAVDGADHKVFYVPHLRLVVDLVNKARLFLGVVADEDLA